ncbi:MAG: alanine racemase [Oscillospiraceae bacterium]|nr:alanine racemase [Oscillospiraceae bacterium]
MKILNRTEATVSLANLAHNFNEIKRHTGDADIIAVVKADAYGHGSVEVARLFEKLGAAILAVACLDEALELRTSGISAPIMILGATPVHFVPILSKHSIIQSVHSFDYAKELAGAASALGEAVAVHIKLDTGMSRFGLYAHKASLEHAAEEALAISNLDGLRADGIFTHFAEAENPDTSFTDEQFENFIAVCDILKSHGKTFKFCHCANSAAVVNYKRAHLSCVRPGLLLYGYYPSSENTVALDLRPALTLKSIIADIRDIKKGDSISYNRTFIAEHDMKVAVVCCGYADGISRALSNRGAFLINGHRAPIVGNVCMDLTVVDVSDIPDIKPFDEVVIFGEQNGSALSPNELASLSGTITYELLTSISKRVPRTYCD